jgi:aspartate/methionine/tyrosine aminotransferase
MLAAMNPTHPAQAINDDVERAHPALFALLSDLGREAVYPPDIPFQAAQARGKRYNATIGQITDGHGRILAPPALERQIESLGGDRNAALLYSPVEGREPLRSRWRERHRPAGTTAPSSLPLVVCGLTHGLSLVADLFCGPGRTVVIPAPFWGNYRQIFTLRRGARVVPADVYRGGRFEPNAIRAALDALPDGEPALVLLNLPANPVGYSPTATESDRVAEALAAAAERRPLMVVCDDAYAGLVYEDGVPRESLFWRLATVSERLVPVKIDGCTKELVFFGGRVAFLTFPFEPDSPAARALESKAKCILRATVGSPPALTQEVALAALASDGVEDEIEEIRRVLAGRYRALRRALDASTPGLLRPLPFNSGCFALIELPAGVDAEALRQRLLADFDTGVVSNPPRWVRIAYCSVAEEAIPELVSRIEAGVRALSSRESIASR